MCAISETLDQQRGKRGQVDPFAMTDRRAATGALVREELCARSEVVGREGVCVRRVDRGAGYG